jgi:hypothetical protein
MKTPNRAWFCFRLRKGLVAQPAVSKLVNLNMGFYADEVLVSAGARNQNRITEGRVNGAPLEKMVASSGFGNVGSFPRQIRPSGNKPKKRLDYWCRRF